MEQQPWYGHSVFDIWYSVVRFEICSLLHCQFEYNQNQHTHIDEKRNIQKHKNTKSTLFMRQKKGAKPGQHKRKIITKKQTRSFESFRKYYDDDDDDDDEMMNKKVHVQCSM